MDYENIHLALNILPLQLWNTVYMVMSAAFFAVIIGLPLGIVLTITGKGHIKEQSAIYKTLELTINIGRSFPFAILMIALIPLTRFIIGTSLGTSASIVPLTVAAAPFFARLVESSLNEIDKQIVQAAVVMGSNTRQVVTKVLLPEALPSIVSAITLTVINLVGYSAMAGLVGGGGLGQVAIQYGYYRFNTPIMVLTVIILILLVQFIQWFGGYFAKKILKQRGANLL